MNPVISIAIQQAIYLLANLILGSGVLDRIVARVEEWANAEISSAQKRNNVLSDLEVIGLKLTESSARLGIELALKLIRTKAAKPE